MTEKIHEKIGKAKSSHVGLACDGAKDAMTVRHGKGAIEECISGLLIAVFEIERANIHAVMIGG